MVARFWFLVKLSRFFSAFSARALTWLVITLKSSSCRAQREDELGRMRSASDTWNLSDRVDACG